MVLSLHALGAWLLLSSASSDAQVPDEITITWDGPPSCPRPVTLEAEVGQRLGPEAHTLQATSIALSIRELATRGYALTLDVEGGAGPATRSVELADCAEVHRASALLIVTALVPEPAPGDPVPPVQERAEGEAEVASHSSAPSAVESRPWSLRAGVLGDLQALPGRALGPTVGFGWGPRSARFWADLRYLVSEQADEVAVPVAIDLFAGALGSAYVFRRGAFAFGPYAEAEFGGLRARSQGSRGLDRAAWGPWASVWLGALWEVALHERLALGLGAALGVPLRRPAFYVEGARAHETPTVSARAQLGIKLLLGTKNRGEVGQ